MDVSKWKRPSLVRDAIGLVALVAAAVVGILEMRARSGAIQAVKRLEEAHDAVEANRFAPALTKERVQTILGRPPAGPDVVEGYHDRQTYVWRGVFRRYTLRDFLIGDFGGGGPKTLHSFRLD
jgi:hypothetical protein